MAGSAWPGHWYSQDAVIHLSCVAVSLVLIPVFDVLAAILAE